MARTLRANWNRLWREVWRPLGESAIAHDVTDLYAMLIARAQPSLMPEHRLPPPGLEAVVNDPVQARSSFQWIAGAHFASERNVAVFLEQVSLGLGEYENGVQPRYQNLIARFVESHNLRYVAEGPPLRLRTALPGMLADQHDQLQATLDGDDHLRPMLLDLQHAVAQFCAEQSPNACRECLRLSSNLLEGVTEANSGMRGATLGPAADASTKWPHAAMKQSLKNLFGFLSDYPHIRHSGSPASKLRELDCSDAILLAALAVAFGCYLAPGARSDSVLSGE